MLKLVAAAGPHASSAARLLGPGAAIAKGSIAMLLQLPAAIPLLLLAPMVAVLSLLLVPMVAVLSVVQQPFIPLRPLLLSLQLKMLQFLRHELSCLLRRHAWHERCGVVL